MRVDCLFARYCLLCKSYIYLQGEEVTHYEKNLSAEEAAQKKGTRLHEENGNLERKKGFSS